MSIPEPYTYASGWSEPVAGSTGLIIGGAASLSVSGNATANGIVDALGSASIAASSSAVVNGVIQQVNKLDMQGESSASAIGTLGLLGTANPTTSSTLSATSTVEHFVPATLLGQGSTDASSSSGLPGSYQYISGWSQPLAASTDAPSVYGQATLASSATVISAGIVEVVVRGSASLSVTATLQGAFRPYYTYNVELPYNSDVDYEGLTSKPINVDIETVPSNARGHLLTPYEPDTDIAPSQARGVDITIESNNYFDMSPMISVQVARNIWESITDYEGISVPYDNNGEYNLGPYEPVVGLSPRSYIDLVPSFSVTRSADVEAIIEGYITTTVFSESSATEIEIITNNTLEIDTVSSSSATQSVEIVVDHTETIGTAASTDQAVDFELVTNNNIEIGIQPSESATGFMYGGPQQDRSIDIVVQPSTAVATTLSWGQGQTLQLVESPSISSTLDFDLYLEKDITIDTFIQPSFTDPKRLASVGNLQDTLKGKVALARRTRAFAMR